MIFLNSQNIENHDAMMEEKVYNSPSFLIPRV